jgi:hypothetical protein
MWRQAVGPFLQNPFPLTAVPEFCDVIVAILRRGTDYEHNILFDKLFEFCGDLAVREPGWKIVFEFLTVVDVAKKVKIRDVIENVMRKVSGFSAIIDEVVFQLIWCLPIRHRKEFLVRNEVMLRSFGSQRIEDAIRYVGIIE